MRYGNALLQNWKWAEQLPRDVVSTQLPALDESFGGFPRGAITEIFGVASSGRTTLLHAFLASATSQGEYCALVDTSGSFDPESAESTGVELSRLFWVRCGGDAEHALRCADLLIHGGGWGVIVLDLAAIPSAVVSRIPVSYWYRFRRAVEPTPTVLIVLESEPHVRACASLALEMKYAEPVWRGTHPSFRYLHNANFRVVPKKPANHQPARFEAKAIG